MLFLRVDIGTFILTAGSGGKQTCKFYEINSGPHRSSSSVEHSVSWCKAAPLLHDTLESMICKGYFRFKDNHTHKFQAILVHQAFGGICIFPGLDEV